MEVFDLLADDTRRRIVELLAEQELAAGEIAAQFPVSGPAISRHLRVLRDGGLVRYRRDGQKWVYALNPRPLVDVDTWLRHNVERWERAFARLGDHLDRMEEHELND